MLRDLAGVHGTWRRVAETKRALELVGEWLRKHEVSQAHWLVDRPVSNSGRLRELILDVGRANGRSFEVEVVGDVDQRLIANDGPVITSDSHILDHCREWVDLLGPILREHTSVWMVDLGPD